MVTIRFPALAAYAFVPCLSPLLAQGPGPSADPDATAFSRGLRRVHENMARGRFKLGLSQLQAVLAKHEKRNYVFERKAEILEDFRRCSFFLKFPAPTLNEALHGRVLSFDPKTQRLGLGYTPKQLDDFAEPEAPEGSHRKLTWHPVIWRGPHTIELRGMAYRQTVHAIDRIREVRVSGAIHVCGTDAGHLEIAFGNQRATFGATPARVVQWSRAGQKELEKRDSPARIGAEFRVRVEVGKSHVRGYFGKKQLFKVKRPPGDGVRFAIEGREFDELTVEGKIDPGWVQDRIDHQRQLQVDEFDRKYDAEAVPEWLLDGEIPSQRSFNPAQAWPSDAREQHHPILRDIVWYFDNARYEEGLAYVDDLDRDILPSSTRLYLQARFYSALDEIEKAANCCERLVREQPGFITGRQLRAELRVRQGQGEAAAIEDYRAMIREHEHARELYVDLAVLLIQAGRASEAGEVLKSAVRKTGNANELMTLQRMLLAVTRGPQWERTFEHRSTHYLVRSNIDEAICRRAAQILEDAQKIYEKALGKPRRRAKDPYRVFLFAGRTGYERFCSDILGERETHTAGLYSASLKQLLIWNLPDKERMLRTIRHEGFHQFLDSLVHDAPAWLNEGLAEYFESVPEEAGAQNGRKHLRKDHLRLLKFEGMMPTAKFLRMPWRVFYRGSMRNYAQAWATVHFLRHGPEIWRPLLPAVLGALSDGKSPKTAVRSALRGLDLEALHKDLQAWLESLRQ